RRGRAAESGRASRGLARAADSAGQLHRHHRGVDPMLTAPADRHAADTIERRTAPRITAATFPGITGIRISPMGTDATLVNLSSTGALVRCLTRLLPGTPVTLVFEG